MYLLCLVDRIVGDAASIMITRVVHKFFTSSFSIAHGVLCLNMTNLFSKRLLLAYTYLKSCRFSCVIDQCVHKLN